MEELQKELIKKKEAQFQARLDFLNCQRKLSLAGEEIKSLENRIKLQQKEHFQIEITDHAIVKYCERILEINIQKIKADILSENVIKNIKELGGQGEFISKNCILKMQNNKVVTIIPHKKISQ